MEIIPNAEKESTPIEHVQCALPRGPQGEGKEPQLNEKDEESKKCSDVTALNCEIVKERPETPRSSEKVKKESTLASLKKLVRGSSRVRSEQEEKHENSAHEGKDEKAPKDSKISRMFQNVSSSMSLRRVWGSSSATRVTDVEGEQAEQPTDVGSSGGLGKTLFRRKSLSKTELDSPDGRVEGNRFKSLGNLFGRRSTAKTDDTVDPEMKSLTLGRRLSSTFRGAFKSDRLQQQVQEAP